MNKMQLGKITAIVVTAGMALTACSSTGGSGSVSGSSAGQGGLDSEQVTIALISHGAPGDTFWDLVRKGAEDAAAQDNVELRYSSDPQAPNQANLVQTAIDSGVDGIAVTLPNAEAIGPAAQKAVDAGIPVVGLNAGMTAYQDYGLSGFFGQDESVAGEAVGKRLGEEGAKHVLCVIHEQGNSSQEARCAGTQTGAGSGTQVETLYVNGQDLTQVQSTVQAKLAQDPSIDWILGLQAAVALATVQAAEAANSTAKVATFDTNAELVTAIEDGKVLFAVDQQPYVQGYLAVDALWMATRNGSTVGGGQPVLTGPSFVDATNVAKIASAAAEGLR